MNYTKKQKKWGKYALLGAGGLFAVSIFVYVGLVFKTVSYTAEKQHTYTSMRSLSAKVGELEARYIVIKNTITAEMAFELGFKEVEAKSYITKPVLGLSY